MRELFEAVSTTREIDPLMRDWRPGDLVPEGYREMFGRLARLDPVALRNGIEEWSFQDKDGYNVKATKSWAEKLNAQRDGVVLQRKPASNKPSSPKNPSRESSAQPTSNAQLGDMLNRALRASRGLGPTNLYGFKKADDIVDMHPYRKKLEAIFDDWRSNTYKDRYSLGTNLSSLKKAAKAAGPNMFKGKQQSNWDWAFLGALLDTEKYYELGREAAWQAGGLSNWTELFDET
jgi:hypothetical protein